MKIASILALLSLTAFALPSNASYVCTSNAAPRDFSVALDSADGKIASVTYKQVERTVNCSGRVADIKTCVVDFANQSWVAEIDTTTNTGSFAIYTNTDADGTAPSVSGMMNCYNR